MNNIHDRTHEVIVPAPTSWIELAKGWSAFCATVIAVQAERQGKRYLRLVSGAT